MGGQFKKKVMLYLISNILNKMLSVIYYKIHYKMCYYLETISIVIYSNKLLWIGIKNIMKNIFKHITIPSVSKLKYILS